MAVDRKLANVWIHGVGFMLFFTAFQTSSQFQATVLKDVLGDAELGFISLAIIYSVFAFFNFVSAPIVHVLGKKWSMVAGAVIYGLFIAAFIHPLKETILAASALLGMAAAVLWTAQGSFITDCTNASNRGLYSGIFWTLLQTSLIIGSLMGIFVVKGRSDIPVDTAQLFYEILTGVAAAGIITLLFVLPLKKSPRLSELEDTAEDPASKLANEYTVKDSLVSTFHLLADKDMLALSVLIMYSGLELTFWSSKYATMLGGTITPGPTLPSAFKPQLIGISGLIIGISQFIGGVSMGRIADKFGRSTIIMIALFLHASAFFLVFLNMLSNVMTPNIYLGLACSFLLGLGDSAVNTALYSMLGHRFETNSVAAFALFKFFQSLAAGAAFFYAGHLDAEYQLLIMGVFLLAGAFFFVRVERTVKFQTKYHRIQDES